ncbi:MAG: hypothetical protein LBR16_05495 [Treponema sp.]|jgi:hypothetical protein|nr:hypothetical protein [Treponema sp.]
MFSLVGTPAFLAEFYTPAAGGSALAAFCIYSLPDGLWLLSCILCIRALWLENPATATHYLYAVYVAALLLELLQYFHIIPGTFDFWDLFAMGFFAFVEGVVYMFLQRRIRYAYQS